LTPADPKKTLFLCWPDTDRFALHSLAAFHGDVLCYVGEHHAQAATADDEFRLLLQQWTLEDVVLIPRLPGSRDSLRVYRRTRTH
jgi:hypothetical protein